MIVTVQLQFDCYQSGEREREEEKSETNEKSNTNNSRINQIHKPYTNLIAKNKANQPTELFLCIKLNICIK